MKNCNELARVDITRRKVNLTFAGRTAGASDFVQSGIIPKKAKPGVRRPLPQPPVGAVVRVSEDPRSASQSVIVQRPTRNRKRPSKFLDYVPPAENKPRAEGVRSCEAYTCFKNCSSL